MIATCTAVVAALNNPGLFPTLGATAARSWDDETELETLANRRVFVIPRAVETIRIARSQPSTTVSLDVVIQQKTSDPAVQDAIAGLAESIADVLTAQKIAGYTVDVNAVTPMLTEHYRRYHVHTALVSLTVRRR
jgi:kynurenine formamidase